MQQRDACFTAVDDAFVNCARFCSTDPCVQFQCGPSFGMAVTACNDQYSVCLETGGNPEVCETLRVSCTAAAGAAYRSCLPNACTTTCTVSLEAITWSAVKHLYRE